MVNSTERVPRRLGVLAAVWCGKKVRDGGLLEALRGAVRSAGVGGVRVARPEDVDRKNQTAGSSSARDHRDPSSAKDPRPGRRGGPPLRQPGYPDALGTGGFAPPDRSGFAFFERRPFSSVRIWIVKSLLGGTSSKSRTGGRQEARKTNFWRGQATRSHPSMASCVLFPVGDARFRLWSTSRRSPPRGQEQLVRARRVTHSYTGREAPFLEPKMYVFLRRKAVSATRPRTLQPRSRARVPSERLRRFDGAAPSTARIATLA